MANKGSNGGQLAGRIRAWATVMSHSKTPLLRRHRQRSDDGKGIRRLIAGKRFRVPAGTSPRESDHRFLLLEKLWQENEAFCRRIGRDVAWTDIALWAANHICKGATRVPLPPTAGC